MVATYFSSREVDDVANYREGFARTPQIKAEILILSGIVL